MGTRERVPDKTIESAFSPNTSLTFRTNFGSQIDEATYNSHSTFAPVAKNRELSFSPFRSNLSCSCGARSIDNRCITRTTDTMPFEEKTPAQSAWMNELWSAQVPYALQPAELFTVARVGPQW